MRAFWIDSRHIACAHLMLSLAARRRHSPGSIIISAPGPGSFHLAFKEIAVDFSTTDSSQLFITTAAGARSLQPASLESLLTNPCPLLSSLAIWSPPPPHPPSPSTHHSKRLSKALHLWQKGDKMQTVAHDRFHFPSELKQKKFKFKNLKPKDSLAQSRYLCPFSN